MRYFLAAVVLTLSLGLSPLATAAEAPPQSTVLSSAGELVEFFFDQVRAVLSLEMAPAETPQPTERLQTAFGASEDLTTPNGDIGPGLDPNS